MLPEIKHLEYSSCPLLQGEPLRALGSFCSDYIEGVNKASVSTFSPSKRQAKHNDIISNALYYCILHQLPLATEKLYSATQSQNYTIMFYSYQVVIAQSVPGLASVCTDADV
jgi:hypothetical protein